MSVKQHMASRRERERRICTGARAVEWILVASASWAALVMGWTPAMRSPNPPPFYHVINSFSDAYLIAFSVALSTLVHAAGLLLSSCECEPGLQDAHEECGCQPRFQQLGSRLRRLGVLGQCATWLFLTAIYGLLWLQRGEVTFGSGMVVILLACASLCSFCISKEHSRSQIRVQVAQLIAQSESSAGEKLARLREIR